MVLQHTPNSSCWGTLETLCSLFISMKPLHLRFRKQYRGYVRHWSLQHDKVVTAYCGSLLVGHCTNEQFTTTF